MKINATPGRVNNFTLNGSLQPPTVRYGRAPTPKLGRPARSIKRPSFWPNPTGGK